tara:strand:- start:265 stop:531 length:267 start_codon:yes stop_codon:yes gene_type:complete
MENKTKQLIQERAKDYGNPKTTFKIISDLWNSYLRNVKNIDTELKPSDVSNLMALLKLGRNLKKNKDDNIDDMIAYVEITKYLKKLKL